ncbi:MAG: hypothetical protein ACFCD0_07155 [Gemmataceae bacterium]
MLGKHTTKVESDKLPLETLDDVCDALELIGKFKEADEDELKIIGSCKFGAQTVRLTATLTPDENGTHLVIKGSSDDIWGVAAKSGVRRLVEAIQNIDNEFYKPSVELTEEERASGWMAFPILGLLVCLAAAYHYAKITEYEAGRGWLSLWGPFGNLYETGGKWAVVGTELAIAGVLFVCGIVMFVLWRRASQNAETESETQ